MSANPMMAVLDSLWTEDAPRPATDRAEARKHRIAERLALGDSRADAERFADAVDAWLRRLDAEETVQHRPAMDGVC
ncbi:hypothetical protein [Azospirillum sp.]|uniref:hypothetical protein n=1 Tax=Azospirillum sp. TaxID=34012 RepID=UPI002D6FA4B5|nr:hypothetical protein [Azospirillum sp.]HYF89572.1 hypothetical protein [Azospirillum sp.]